MNAVWLVAVAMVLVLLAGGLAVDRRVHRRRLSQARTSACAPGNDWKMAALGEGRRGGVDRRGLDLGRRREYVQQWMRIQEQFIGDPVKAIRQADRLATLVMQDRGYPTAGVNHAGGSSSGGRGPEFGAVRSYHAAHTIAALNDHRAAAHEQLREAMIHFRSLFFDLLGDRDR